MPTASLGPLTFAPLLKRARWGGTRLSSVLGKPAEGLADCAESWEVADHGEDQSLVAGGPCQGLSLRELLRLHPAALLGRHAARRQFPLLVKFLDATDRLSLQVHPDDRQAAAHRPGENGKTEAWVVIDADPGARLWVGLARETTREQLTTSLGDGSLEECLHSFPARPGQCVLVPAGTVHAIGEGVLLAEIQQSSDLTFRLHDWGRVDQDGRPRELHLDQGLDCTDFSRGPVDPVEPVSLSESEDHVVERLLECPYFVLHRHRVGRDAVLENDDRCRILMVLEGRGSLVAGETSLPLDVGQTVVVPAEVVAFEVAAEERLTLLEAFLP